MTYNEAKQIIDENFNVVNPHMVNSKPPHRVLRSLIAPIGSPLNTLVQMDSFLIDEHIPNDEVLLQMNLFDNNLEPYIVYKMSGSVIIWPLKNYLGASWNMDDDSGNAV